MTSARVSLPARIDPIVAGLLAGPQAVTDLVETWGTPLNLLFPQVFEQNLQALRTVLDDRGVRHRIHFAHKANQSRALLRAALRAGIGVDVASAGELAAATSVGFGPDRIEVTGPKGRRLLSELVGSGVTINVDNLWELSEIVRLAGERTPTPRVPVLLRLSGFEPAGAGRTSRFGLPVHRFGEAIDLLRANPRTLDLLGLAFHLDSSDVREKVRAVDACLRGFETAWSAGLTPRVLNFGGGFRQVFTADVEAFDRYVQALRRGLAGAGPALTWNANMLGYRYQDGVVRGTPVFHKYANTGAAVDGLAELLDAPLPGQGGRAIAQVLRENLIEVWIEPGKALVDQAGITLAQVEFSTAAADGSTLVVLDLSRDKICPADQEVMLDPVLLPGAGAGAGSAPAVEEAAPVGVYFAGNLCLERDMIFNHVTFLDRLPRPGDIVCFVNTAGYQMDLSASEALLHPRPRKVAVTLTGGAVTAEADELQEAGPCCTTTSPS